MCRVSKNSRLYLFFMLNSTEHRICIAHGANVRVVKIKILMLNKNAHEIHPKFKTVKMPGILSFKIRMNFITQTRLCNILQFFFKAVKMIIFR